MDILQIKSNDPKQIFLDEYKDRLDLAFADFKSGDSKAVARLATLLQETETVDRSIRHFVSAMGLSGKDSSLVHWCDEWRSISPFDQEDVCSKVFEDAQETHEDLLDAAMILGAQRVGERIDPDTLADELPNHDFCKARRMILCGEAAYQLGDWERARNEYDGVHVIAPHVTISHRRLAQLAWREKEYQTAKQHFEASCAMLLVSWRLGDKSENLPNVLFSLEGWIDLFRYRGHLYVVPSLPKYIGVVGSDDQLLLVPDTIAYHLWKNIFHPLMHKFLALPFVMPFVDKKIAERVSERSGRNVPTHSKFNLFIMKWVFKVRPIDDQFRGVTIEEMMIKSAQISQKSARHQRA